MRDSYNHDRIVIGIGGECSVAYQMRRLGLRQASYPLDWFGMPNAGRTASLIQKGFTPFMQRDNLDVVGVTDNGLFYHVVDRNWDCHSFHDFPVVEGEFPLYNYDQFHQLLQKRIRRFLDDLRMETPITLIRMGYSQQDISLLVEAISIYRKHPFELLLVKESAQCKQPECMEKHNNTSQYLIPIGPSWYGNDEAWGTLMDEVLNISER